jgi:hypothetical protein
MTNLRDRIRVGPDVTRVLAPSVAALAVAVVTLLIVGWPGSTARAFDRGELPVAQLMVGALALFVLVMAGIGLVVSLAVWIRGAARRR